MRLREAVPLDLPVMGQIQVDANLTDTLSTYFRRDIDKFPLTHLRGSTKFVKRRATDIGAVSFVVETEPSDYPADQRHKAPEVIAFAIWTRAGNSKQAQKWQQNNSGWYASLNRALHGIEDRYDKMFPSTNCTFVQERFAELLPYLREEFDPEIFSEAWYLGLLMVDPRWQRRGLGRRLMQWGFDRANEEKVPVLVKSSSLGGPAYKGVGFKLIGELKLNKVFNTLEHGGVEPGFWVWEPEGCEGMFIDRARQAFNQKHKKDEAT